MVGIKFNGRLGNQLFQYFFLLYLKSRDNSKIYFFTNPHHAYLTKYFDLGTYHNLTLGSKIYSIFARGVPKILSFKDIYVHNFFAPKERTPVNFTIYNGFFQSDFYVKHLPAGVIPTIKKEFTDQFDNKFGEIFKKNKTVVVHIRRTDYLSYGKRDISLPIEYFKKQLNSIENLNNYKVFFVSDDMDFVRKEFPEKDNYIFSSNSEILDFQLIHNADVAIISNSTFAWWAAYLCPKKNTVIAPKNWFGFRIGREHPIGIMTDRFIWRDVLE
ncbi:alpha-1,2-fucosyltransferase [Dyadobacter subterraneus]|uniref:Alpha-1,2-fucosyltransferase n=1 Tax=Dyadobacter subterraneus TaxID=2773304 RepID=A0ABR9WCC4_9BACT|nr:alpha-1,2-fucosyltransferase [Dyadobacter subterraneus]MBE9463125.1 alpha-1,2-fucosyltransferase [Dyadobacter subterraneus]